MIKKTGTALDCYNGVIKKYDIISLYFIKNIVPNIVFEFCNSFVDKNCSFFRLFSRAYWRTILQKRKTEFSKEMNIVFKEDENKERIEKLIKTLSGDIIIEKYKGLELSDLIEIVKSGNENYFLDYDYVINKGYACHSISSPLPMKKEIRVND